MVSSLLPIRCLCLPLSFRLKNGYVFESARSRGSRRAVLVSRFATGVWCARDTSFINGRHGLKIFLIPPASQTIQRSNVLQLPPNPSKPKTSKPTSPKTKIPKTNPPNRLSIVSSLLRSIVSSLPRSNVFVYHCLSV